MSRLGLMSLPFGNALLRHGALVPSAERGERPMQQFKDLNACIAELRAVQARSDIKPEQRKNVEAAVEELKRLRRKPHAKTADVYRCVREIAGRLLEAFLK